MGIDFIDDWSYINAMDKKQLKKNEVLKNSIRIMYLKGYYGTSVKDITVSAGIPKGSFYTYFVDKEHYAVDAIEYYREVTLAEKFKILVDIELSPLDRIRGFYLFAINNIKNNKFLSGCFVGNLTQEMGENSDLIKSAATNFHNNLVELIYNNLVEAKNNGEIGGNQDLKIIASFINSSWQGTILRVKASTSDVLDEFMTVLNTLLLK